MSRESDEVHVYSQHEDKECSSSFRFSTSDLKVSQNLDEIYQIEE